MSNHRRYDQVKARLVLRLVRACAQSEIADSFGYDWPDFVLMLNTDPAFRRVVMESSTVAESLEPLDF